ncbi:MAG: hypothetical protein A2V99_03510 [Spirochaetes bacterium RBG_16_67_19]|nr:MAG: hypothetical protein A2V99_03510 [Spirochaetes bacterium RBG_16_67_19]
MPPGAPAQEQLAADLSDPLLYTLLEICSLKGALPPLSVVKPYRAGEVRRLLQAALDNPGRLSPRELSLLRQLRDRLPPASASLARAQVEMESAFRANLSAPGALHWVNQVRGSLRGSLGGALAYDLNLGLFFDTVDPEAFVPYAFSKEWDGFHVWAEDGEVDYSDGISSPGFSFSSLPALSLDLWDSRINLHLSRYRRQWGLGEGSLSLSGTARPIIAFAGSVEPAPRWRFHFLDGTLGDWSDSQHEQKMLSIHRLEWFPRDWLYLSPWESVVYAKRLELSYLNPIGSYYVGQQINGDLDNVAFGGEAAVTIRPYFRLYFSLFVDEIVLVPLSRLFTRPENQFAWQAGLKIPIPWLPFALLTLQYTKIEPYCYTHYEQTVPMYTQPVNINYAHDGENMGYHLPPNSDELLLRLFTHPADGLELTAQYQLIRHGDGDHPAQIEGDIDSPIYPADLQAGLYREKDFLHDGIYEWIHALTVGAGYRFKGAPLKAWAKYSFVHAANYDNSPGKTVIKNLVGLGLSWSSSVGRP